MKAVSFVLPSFAAGGAERVMLTFASALDRAKYQVSLIVLSEAGALRDMVPADVPVTVLDRPRLRSALVPLCRALRRTRPDVAITTMAYMNFGVLSLRPFLPRFLLSLGLVQLGKV